MKTYRGLAVAAGVMLLVVGEAMTHGHEVEAAPWERRTCHCAENPNNLQTKEKNTPAKSYDKLIWQECYCSGSHELRRLGTAEIIVKCSSEGRARALRITQKTKAVTCTTNLVYHGSGTIKKVAQIGIQ